MYRPLRNKENQSGLALIIVLFVVALASILVINMTYSTYLGSRISVAAERSVQAEYLLKSALNFARAIIKADDTTEDSPKDYWGQFTNGVVLPAELLNISAPNVRIELEIRPEGAKINLRPLLRGPLAGNPDVIWRGVLERLCTKLELDKTEESEGSGGSQGDQYTCKQLIANLIDYFDPDKEPYDSDGFVGTENENSGFPNRDIERISEIAAVPGFTAARVQKLLPFVTVQSGPKININLAPRLVLLSLHPDIDDAQVDKIITFRTSDEGPFTSYNKMQDFISSDAFDSIQTYLDVQSSRFQVLAKVEYGTSTHFLRSYLSKNGRNQLPTIESLELF